MLIGNATLSDGPNVTKGERVLYDINTGVANIETTPGGRVRALFVPGKAARPDRRRQRRAGQAPPSPSRSRSRRRTRAGVSSRSIMSIVSDQPVKPLFNRSQPGPSDASLLDARPAGTAPHVVSRGESEAVFGGPGILAVKGLQKSYRGRTVVQDAGLNVRAGEAVGLLGPNGAGKTTIFYMITGLVGGGSRRHQPRRP